MLLVHLLCFLPVSLTLCFFQLMIHFNLPGLCVSKFLSGGFWQHDGGEVEEVCVTLSHVTEDRCTLAPVMTQPLVCAFILFSFSSIKACHHHNHHLIMCDDPWVVLWPKPHYITVSYMQFGHNIKSFVYLATLAIHSFLFIFFILISPYLVLIPDPQPLAHALSYSRPSV